MVRLILVKLPCNKFNECPINVFLVIACKQAEGLSDLYLLAFYIKRNFIFISKQIFYGKGKGHPCTGTEALYRPYGP